MHLFWTLWGVDALIALICLYFFFVGLADGSVSAFNGGLWFLILVGLGIVLGGSLWLKAQQQVVWAKVLVALLAVPGLLAGIFLLIVLIAQPRWN
jgi:hypothetical protein